ncbi:hypothetical protein FRC12_017208 [Ceratobasidium sp. 428]|nr:hypothetical protein FRC12_017208 [Ceratobasidium sp. 428]
MNLEAPEGELRLPPIRTLLPVQTYGMGPDAMSVAEQTRRAMRGSGAGISRDVLLYGPAGVTPAPAELARNNVHDKLPPIPPSVPPRRATFFAVQSVPFADSCNDLRARSRGSTRSCLFVPRLPSCRNRPPSSRATRSDKSNNRLRGQTKSTRTLT